MPSHSLAPAVAALAMAAGALAIPATVSAGTPVLHCGADYDVTADPGLGLKKADQDYRSENGKATCTGLINGHRPTGPGTWTDTAKGPGNSCAAGSGQGSFTMVIPTDGGDQTLTRAFTYKFPTLPSHGGVIGGSIGGKGLKGTFDAVPVTGDCATTPVTRVHVIAGIDFG
jgi:hypothetical protein